jgi:acyl carrier protein
VREATPLTFEAFALYLADGVGMEAEAFVQEARLDEDLGLDSFDMLELVVRIEELGIRLPEEAVMDVAVVGDLYRVYRQRADRG